MKRDMISLMHARIVNDQDREKRQAAAKSGVANSRKARLKRIGSEIDAEWKKRDRAS